MNYTKEIYRGLATEDCIYEGQVTPVAVPFPKEGRDDGYCELSINWNDDEGAVEEILSKKKVKDPNKTQFSYGAAEIDFEKMTGLLNNQITSGRFRFERREVDGNNYHGNLLLKSGTPRPIKMIIQSGICLCVNRIIENPNK